MSVRDHSARIAVSAVRCASRSSSCRQSEDRLPTGLDLVAAGISDKNRRRQSSLKAVPPGPANENDGAAASAHRVVSVAAKHQRRDRHARRNRDIVGATLCVHLDPADVLRERAQEVDPASASSTDSLYESFGYVKKLFN